MVFEIKSLRACVMTRASAKSVDASKPKVIRATASAAVGGLNPRGIHSKIAITQPTHRTRSRALARLFALLASIVFWSATSTAWSLEVDCSGEVTYGWGEGKSQRDRATIYSTGGDPNGCGYGSSTDISYTQTFAGTRSDDEVSQQTNATYSLLARMDGGNSNDPDTFAIMVAKSDRSGWDTISNASCKFSDGSDATLQLSSDDKAVLVTIDRVENPNPILQLNLPDFYQPSADDVTCTLSITTDTGATLTDVLMRRTDLYFIQGQTPAVRGQHIFEGGVWSSTSSTTTPPSTDDPDTTPYLIQQFLATRSKHMLAASPGSDRAHARLRELCVHRDAQDSSATVADQERVCPEEPKAGAGFAGSSSTGARFRGTSPGGHESRATNTSQLRYGNPAGQQAHGPETGGPQPRGLARALNLTGEGTVDRDTVSFATSLRDMRKAAAAEAKSKQGGATAYAGSSSAQALAQRPFGWDI